MKESSLSGAANGTGAPKYFPALDGMRLLAIGAVVLHHALGRDHQSWVLRVLSFQEGNGFGVPLFLILSGLLLTSILLNTSHHTHRFRNFLLRRAIRIFPLYFGYLALAWVVTMWFSPSSMQHIWIYCLFLQSTFLKAAEQTQSFLPLYHFWTLGVQEQFYFVWPLLVWGCKSMQQLRWVCWFGIVGSFLFRVVLATMYGPGDHLVMLLPCRVGELCLGALLAVEIYSPSNFSRILPKFFVPLSGIYVLWAIRGLDFERPLGSILGLQLVSFACASLVVSCLQPNSVAGRIFGSKLLGSAGKKYSFAIYVFHPMMLMIFALPSVHLGIARYPLMVLSLGLLVWCSYNLYEKHFLTIKAISTTLKGAAFSCPSCRSREICRTQRVGLLDRRVLPLIGLYRWECFDCQSSFSGRRQLSILTQIDN